MPVPGRIIYNLTRASGPSGGIKAMLEHVEALRGAGFDAHAYLKTMDQGPTAFPVTVPVLSGAIRIERADIVVRPETFLARDLEAAAKGGIRQAVFVQNHYYCRHSLGTAARYGDLGVEAVFCSSFQIKRFLEDNRIAEDVPVVPYAIAPVSPTEKREQIATMPRKRRFEQDFIRHLLVLRYPDLASVPWVEIADLPHAETLRVLADSAVFLSLQRFEGFGLPALEAMAAGCAVAGFAGGAEREYASDANGHWAPEDDLIAATDQLALAVKGVRDQTPETLARIDAGTATARRYTAAARDAALIALFETIQAPR